MKRVFYSLAVLASVITFVSCSQDDDNNFGDIDQSLELRASTLGFSNGDIYKSSVLNQCAAGNHENCDILADGTHQVCINSQHSGIKHDGTHHNGTGTGHGGNNHDSNTCMDVSHNHNNTQNHDVNTCTDANHNHNNGQNHDVNTCTDASHNHNGEQNHDVNTCTDKSHNHNGSADGSHNKGNLHN